jgi:two-component system nitrate/nitrite response regulator NarL
MMGETIFPPAFLSFVLESNGPHTVEAVANDQNDEPILVATEDATAPLLSPREKMILRCIIEGDSNKCIARKINIAEATVKVHVKAILRKIRVHNRTQAAIWGINNGSQTQLENTSCTPSISDMSKRCTNPAKAMSQMTQIEPPAPPDRAREAYPIGVARIERLIRKGQRIPSVARLSK